ncbi:MAG TPA: urease subunit beta [Propionibacteriaceae bacterium]|nr:urease subunit beta [Propionibacteriaceae bacterium]
MAGPSSNGPGAIRVQPGWLEINADRAPEERAELTFTNTADRPIQVGSHLHLPDVNSGLSFDRQAAMGFRLDIAAGTSVRFEPGASRRVAVVALRGGRRVPGIQVVRATDGGRLPVATASPQES